MTRCRSRMLGGRAWTENASGEIEIYAHRWKGALAIGGCAIFAVLSLLIGAAGGEGWWPWLSGLGFGAVTVLAGERYRRRGFFSGRPMVVVGPEGISDRSNGLRVAWEEIESLEQWELHVRGSTQRFVGIWAHDPDELVARLPRVIRVLATVPLPGRPQLNIALSMLAVTPEEFAGIVRRYWDGPLRGFDEMPADGRIVRPSRGRRFRGWLVSWAISIAIAIPILVLVIWLT